MADRHLVVVQNNRQIVAEFASVVECFKDDSAGERTIADDRDRSSVFLVHQDVAAAQTNRGADAAARMASHEQVINALVRVWVTHQSASGADRFETFVAPGDQFVRIDLVAGVPDQSIGSKIKLAVQCQAEFHHAQIGREVGRPGREQVA